MAAPNANTLVIGGTNVASSARSTSNDRDIFIRKFGGEVLLPYQQQIKVMPTLLNKILMSGKSFVWPIMGRATAEYQTPGTYEVGDDNVRDQEVTIHADRPIRAIEDIYDFDAKLSHFEVRSALAEELAHAVARADETKACRAIAYAAAQDGPAGITYTADGTDMRTASNRAETISGLASANEAGLVATDGSDFIDALDNIETKIVNMGLDPTQFYILMKPSVMRWFVKSSYGKEAIDRDFSTNAGDLNKRMLPGIGNMKFMVSPYANDALFTNVSSGGWSTGGGEYNTYTNDNSAIAAVVYGPRAVAGVRVGSLQMQVWYDNRADCTALRVKSAQGWGPLRAEQAFQVIVST